MYFTSLPDHTKPSFNEQAHFDNFKKHNIIFNAEVSSSDCKKHIGCLSFKTVFCGEEIYGIDNRFIKVTPGQFLILNNDQSYSSNINYSGSIKTLSVFFKKDFASSVCFDVLNKEEKLLENYADTNNKSCPEFFQTLYVLQPILKLQLHNLITSLNNNSDDDFMMDEHLVFMLRYLLHTQKAEFCKVNRVNAVKQHTKIELYKRLNIAKDFFAFIIQ